jgi:Rho-binding antiterminator
MEIYKPIDVSFHDQLKATVTQRIYSKIQYKTDLEEFITISSLIKNIIVENGEEFIVLLDGEKIRLDRIVSLNGTVAPGYKDFMDLSCDC